MPAAPGAALGTCAPGTRAFPAEQAVRASGRRMHAAVRRALTATEWLVRGLNAKSGRSKPGVRVRHAGENLDDDRTGDLVVQRLPPPVPQDPRDVDEAADAA